MKDPGSLEDLEEADAHVDDLFTPTRKRARTYGELAWVSARALVRVHGLRV